ncbi:hypothetical protein [Parasediminibacterium sp. JCM 36343]|uniref:hypothetical protein n=1 Tax=Parasediminibacterium sp. JCM 36343 TaxID=3374279 RepID=UPI00397A233F
MTSGLKEIVIGMVEDIEDEALLQVLKNDIDYFKHNGSDITVGLTPNQLEELKNLANEPDDKDTLSENEFKKATAKWLMK